jgi:hypothetical protein
MRKHGRLSLFFAIYSYRAFYGHRFAFLHNKCKFFLFSPARPMTNTQSMSD